MSEKDIRELIEDAGKLQDRELAWLDSLEEYFEFIRLEELSEGLYKEETKAKKSKCAKENRFKFLPKRKLNF